MIMFQAPVLIVLITISWCHGSPIRSRQFTSENENIGKLDSIAFEKQVRLYQNESLVDFVQSNPKVNRGKQDKDKENYYILVVSVPETTIRPQQSESNSNNNIINVNTGSQSIPVDINEVKNEPKQEATPAPSLVTRIQNILVHSLRGNITGIVDESFGSGVSNPLVAVINNLLGDSSCNTIRRLLRQCGQLDSEAGTTEETQRALLLTVKELSV